MLYLSCMYLECSILAICPWYCSGMFQFIGKTLVWGGRFIYKHCFFFAPIYLFICFPFETDVLINVPPTYIYVNIYMGIYVYTVYTVYIYIYIYIGCCIYQLLYIYTHIWRRLTGGCITFFEQVVRVFIHEGT